MDNPIQQLIIAYRNEKGLTQTELGEILGCSQDMISKIEKGQRRGPEQHPTLQHWAAVFGNGETPESLRPDIYAY